jgi:hypothetical protein
MRRHCAPLAALLVAAAAAGCLARLQGNNNMRTLRK